MKKAIILLLLLINLSFQGFSQWNAFAGINTLYSQFPLIYGSVGDVIFDSEKNGIYSFGAYLSPSSGSVGEIFQTNDSANTWTANYYDLGLGIGTGWTFCKNGSFYFIKFEMGFARVYHKLISDSNWTEVGSAAYYLDFTLPDTSCYFILHNYGINTYLSKYQNGNYQSTYHTFNTSSYYPTKIYFVDTLTGYLIAYPPGTFVANQIYKSIDGGNTWNFIYSDTSLNISTVFFPTINTGYAISGTNIIKTINGGTTWNFTNVNQNIHLNNLYFFNDSIGFACGDSGLIIKTINGGTNWFQDYTGVTSSFAKVFFVNDSIGFALSGSTIFKTNLNTGIWQISYNNKTNLEIYPNPNAGKCNITVPDEFLNEQNLTLSIFDNTGKLIQQKTLEMNDGKIKLNLEAEAKGIYNVTLSNGVKGYSGKIVFE